MLIAFLFCLIEFDGPIPRYIHRAGISPTKIYFRENPDCHVSVSPYSARNTGDCIV